MTDEQHFQRMADILERHGFHFETWELERMRNSEEVICLGAKSYGEPHVATLEDVFADDCEELIELVKYLDMMISGEVWFE